MSSKKAAAANVLESRKARQAIIRLALDFLEAQTVEPQTSPHLSIPAVAKRFGIPVQTLRDAKKRGVPNRRGPSTMLTTEEEDELAGYCINMQKLGFGLSRPAVDSLVLEILRTRDNQCQRTPSEKWWRRFKRDHPNISFRVPQELTEARAQKGNPIIVKDHFTKLQQIIDEHNLTAGQIWNMDETGFSISSSLQKVLAQKGARNVHKVSGSSKDHVSVCPTISAAGTFIPPLLIYKGVNFIEGMLSGATVPSGTVAAFSDSGYMQENIFQMYIEHFNRKIPADRPVLLILDGHSSHISLASIKFCRDHEIHLYILPSNTTHLLQPCEIPFKTLKSEYRKASDRYRIHHGHEKFVQKQTFARVLGEAFHKTYTPNAIRKAFAACGTWPVNPDVINPERMATSLITEKQVRTPLGLKDRKPAATTRASRIISLEREVEELKVRIHRLEHPGTESLATILKYPLTKSKTLIEEDSTPPLARPKAFKFGTLITHESSAKEFEGREAEKQKKKEDAALKKEQQALKRALKQAEKQSKKLEIEIQETTG